MPNLRYITQSLSGSRKFYAPAGTLALWEGASAPSGWTFETQLDDYFIAGASAVDLTARGSLTHKHWNPPTTTGGAHTDHLVSAPSVSGWASASFEGTPGSASYAGGSHIHDGIAAGTPSSAGDHSHPIADTNTASNLPPYKRLRWIKATAKIEAPVGAIVMHNASPTALGNNWKVCDGTNGTPDLRDKFVYSGSGSDGGSKSHYHTSPDTNAAGDHTHVVHLTTGGVSTLGSNAQSSSSPGHRFVKSHIHETDVTSGIGGSHVHTVGNTSTDTIEPPFVQLYFIKRTV